MKRIFILLLINTFFTSLVTSASVDEKVDSIISELEIHYYSQGAIARNLVKELYKIADEHPQNLNLMAKSIYWDTYVEYSQGKSNDDFIK